MPLFVSHALWNENHSSNHEKTMLNLTTERTTSTVPYLTWQHRSSSPLSAGLLRTLAKNNWERVWRVRRYLHHSWRVFICDTSNWVSQISRTGTVILRNCRASYGMCMTHISSPSHQSTSDALPWFHFGSRAESGRGLAATSTREGTSPKLSSLSRLPHPEAVQHVLH